MGNLYSNLFESNRFSFYSKSSNSSPTTIIETNNMDTSSHGVDHVDIENANTTTTPISTPPSSPKHQSIPSNTDVDTNASTSTNTDANANADIQPFVSEDIEVPFVEELEPPLLPSQEDESQRIHSTNSICSSVQWTEEEPNSEQIDSQILNIQDICLDMNSSSIPDLENNISQESESESESLTDGSPAMNVATPSPLSVGQYAFT